MTLNLGTAKFSVCTVCFAIHNYYINFEPSQSLSSWSIIICKIISRRDIYLHSLYTMQEITSFSLSAYDVSRQLSFCFVAVMRMGSILQWQNIVSQINCLWNIKAFFFFVRWCINIYFNVYCNSLILKIMLKFYLWASKCMTIFSVEKGKFLWL